VVEARNASANPFVSRATRLLANERKLTVCASPLIEGARLLPFKDGASVPEGWLATTVEVVQFVVMLRHMFLTNTFSMPFAVFAPRLDAAEAKAINCPVESNDGRSASAFAGEVPSRVEARNVEGVQVVVLKLKQVSRTYTSCTPPEVKPRFVPAEVKAMKRPFVPEVAVCVLAPFAGVTPSGVDTRSVSPAHVVSSVAHVRENTSASPLGFGAVAPRFRAVDTNAITDAAIEIDGAELGPFPGVVPSGVETKNVVGEHVVVGAPPHVLRTKICGVTPSNVTLDTRFVASDTKATNCPSGLITGLKLSPLPALTPSAPIEMSIVAVVVDVVPTGRQNTCRVLPSRGADVTKFDAVEVNATFAPDEEIVGSQLGPFAVLPLGSTLINVFEGVHDATVTQVARTKTSLEAFVSFFTKLFEMEANATISPFVFVEGPDVIASGVPFAHVEAVPQIPFSACEPSGAKSSMIGSPFVAVGFTENTTIFEVPPPGAVLNTCI
jgi:hypothetical protein